MEGARHEPLAGPRLAQDDHRRRGIRDALDPLAHGGHRRPAPEQRRGREPGLERCLQRRRLLLEPRFVQRAPEEDRQLVLLEGLREVVVRALAD